LLNSKLDATIPIPPNVEASVNPKVEQLTHALEIILNVVRERGDLLTLNLKFLSICKLKITKIPTRSELMQDKRNLGNMSFGTKNARKGEKIETYQIG